MQDVPVVELSILSKLDLMYKTVCGNISYFSYRKGIERFNHVASSYSRETFNPCKTGLEHQYGRRHVHQYDVTSCQNALAIFHIIIILICIVPYQGAKVNSRKGEPVRCVREVYEHVDTSLWCSYSLGCTKYLRSVWRYYNGDLRVLAFQTDDLIVRERKRNFTLNSRWGVVLAWPYHSTYFCYICVAFPAQFLH